MLPFNFFYDPTYSLVIIGMLISAAASSYVQSTFKKYSNFKNQLGYNGSQIARIILDQSGLQDVRIERVPGHLTDHYDPRGKVLRLSDATAQSTSVSSIGVAAHEAGHAMQDRDGYVLMKFRTTLVPLTNFGQTFAFPIILFGLFFGPNQTMLNIGLILFSLTFLFQMVTLPVEFDASKRAMQTLKNHRLLSPTELPMAANVLRAAALTYIAAAIASFLSLLRLFLLFGNRGNRRN
ncbi:zinc metallopeptidase [Allofustis seminis]|uniref:zinc metallopeptidase n=1 Tax=Allofustis seminis TaxID=166939 RepID=UPI0003787515|nr:zinc metallopeptidase [Allofustis seminis]